ncbi:hypothetical protein NDU88_008283 [Pleurodeles waltl]|uniref:Uncharacterized protein n=1 Tax=Pleurodeles waltl TaxID=8319 RepID=A0AAV7VW14_PLEWA|nr:hypothetical protein NDU88_008283 [Pleurodeles waltl]
MSLALLCRRGAPRFRSPGRRTFTGAGRGAPRSPATPHLSGALMSSLLAPKPSAGPSPTRGRMQAAAPPAQSPRHSPVLSWFSREGSPPSLGLSVGSSSPGPVAPAPAPPFPATGPPSPQAVAVAILFLAAALRKFILPSPAIRIQVRRGPFVIQGSCGAIGCGLLRVSGAARWY